MLIVFNEVSRHRLKFKYGINFSIVTTNSDDKNTHRSEVSNDV